MQVRIIYLPHRLAAARFSEGDRHPLIGEIQKLLAKQGLYQTEAHGNYDANTAEAVSQFQETGQLPPTGHVDSITYCRLQQATLLQIPPATALRVNSGLPRANILITKSSRQLTLFDGNQPLRHYPVAIGKPSTPTPEGNYVIATKIINPGGMLGTRWMGLNFESYGIHGTNAPWAIGQMVSHGCIRMHNPNAEELFSLVNVGTPVFIRN
ncbi:MAG: L,D-transpeptidase family protein [Negativicutes bacterium]|nr:L,D-transpeptidase family protein [Negativicutes bacterium]